MSQIFIIYLSISKLKTTVEKDDKTDIPRYKIICAKYILAILVRAADIKSF